jgi:phage-related protein (TIGR01555 family)
MKLADSLINFVSQMATGKSKSVADAFVVPSRSQTELSAIYRGDWIGRKIIDAPAFDMLREWRDWQAEPKLIEAMDAAEERHQLAGKLSRAMRMGRLYGGAGMIIGADVSKPDKPISPYSLGKGCIKYLAVLPRYSFATPEIERDPSSPLFGQPKFYELMLQDGGRVQLDPSRVIRFTGADRLEDNMALVDGWSDSSLLAIYDAIHNAALAQTGIAELIHEAKVDVISIPGLGNSLSTDTGTSQLIKRFTNANTVKSINNMLLLDSQEKWERKQTSFTALPDVIDRYLQIVAAASDIPATRLLGTTSKGLNNTGEGDLRNYYDMLAGMRNEMIGPQLAYLDRIIWLDATGSVPREAYCEWAPMWQMTPKEKADIAKTKAETTKIYAELALMPEECLRLGVQNQLIEDGTYPGLEAAIATLRSSGAPATEDPAAQNDNPTPDHADGGVRDRSPYLAYSARA